MNVLVTGAFGNIGSHSVDALLRLGHHVRALSFGAPESRLTKAWGSKVEVVRGDVTRPETLPAAVRGVDRVVHLAYVIPPACLEKPDEARRVNVDGTLNVLEAVKAHAPTAKFLFASSLDVFGRTSDKPPPRKVTDPVVATDVYTEHKLSCEALVRESGLTWAIFRYADVPPLALRQPVPIMFEIPLSQRMETLHPHDAGLVTARGATMEETWDKVWLVGGGPRCQVKYGDYLAKFMAAMEMGGPLPESAFSTTPYCTDWLDTEESQRVFQYQKHSFEDIVRDVAALLGWKRSFARLSQPVVREYMLGMSPYYRKRRGAT
ncbi:MAG: NAD-dependent epimerase/dehydratase family protein [Myxococcaceae bacterium]